MCITSQSTLMLARFVQDAKALTWYVIAPVTTVSQGATSQGATPSWAAITAEPQSTTLQVCKYLVRPLRHNMLLLLHKRHCCSSSRCQGHQGVTGRVPPGTSAPQSPRRAAV
jgi:hypothetical protein